MKEKKWCHKHTQGQYTCTDIYSTAEKLIMSHISLTSWLLNNWLCKCNVLVHVYDAVSFISHLHLQLVVFKDFSISTSKIMKTVMYMYVEHMKV